MPRKKKVEEAPEPKKTKEEKAEEASALEQELANAPKGRWQKILGSKAFQKIKQDHGATILTTASDVRVAKSFRIPSGIFPLDLALGGGWPQGRVNTIFGMKSAGKTYTLLKTLAQAQHMCSNCWSFVEWLKEVEVDEEVDAATGEVKKLDKPKKVWTVRPVDRWDGEDDKFVELTPSWYTKEDGTRVKGWERGARIKPKCACEKYRECVCGFIDVEGTFDKPWAERLGVNLDKLLLSQPEYAEQSLDIGDALVRSGNCDVLVLDSIAFLTPQKEIEESTEKETMGVQPRVIGKGTRKFVSGINAVALDSERRPTVFLTNQIRMKLGVMFGNPETQPGGLAPGFASAAEVRMRPGKFEFEKEADAEDPNHPKPLWVDMGFDVEKNKSAVPKVGGTIRLVLRDTETKRKGEVADEDMVMVEAQKVGLVRKEGSSWLCMGEDYKTKGEIEEKLLKDIDFSRRLRMTLFKVMNLAETWEETPEQ
jgi:protein RecA